MLVLGEAVMLSTLRSLFPEAGHRKRRPRKPQILTGLYYDILWYIMIYYDIFWLFNYSVIHCSLCFIPHLPGEGLWIFTKVQLLPARLLFRQLRMQLGTPGPEDMPDRMSESMSE